jgi:hypothetical protein
VVSLDGVPITDWKRHHVVTPIFTVLLPPNNIWGVTTTSAQDSRWTAAAQGWFLLFPPLPAGNHVLTLQSRSRNQTWNLLIQKPNEWLE